MPLVHHAVTRMAVMSIMLDGMAIMSHVAVIVRCVVLRAVHYRNSGLRFKDFIRAVIGIMSGMIDGLFSNVMCGGMIRMRSMPIVWMLSAMVG